MRSDQADEFPRSYDLGLLPESRKMLLIARVTASRRVGDRVWLWFLTSCSNCSRSPLRIRSSGRASISPYSCKIARETYKRAGLVRASVSTVRCNPAGLMAAEITTFGVDDQPEGKHYRFRFCDRESLMMRSISLGVKVSVPFRSDSSPMILSTSGSGAANLT